MYKKLWHKEINEKIRQTPVRKAFKVIRENQVKSKKTAIFTLKLDKRHDYPLRKIH